MIEKGLIPPVVQLVPSRMRLMLLPSIRGDFRSDVVIGDSVLGLLIWDSRCMHDLHEANLQSVSTPTMSDERAERVSLILQQLQSLPTLSPIATRLLSLTADDQADVREIIKLIESDPSLTTKVLGLCRRADTGLGNRITTVDRAVVMIGFEAVRNAVLSVEIYDLFSPPVREELPSDINNNTISNNISEEMGSSSSTRVFDRAGFWKHCLGVAVTTEMLIEKVVKDCEFTPSEGFVCGLLHGLGQLALDRLLPRCYARVAEIAEQEMTNIAEAERRIIGVDHHTVGKRLGELWGLPFILQDVMWLYGQPYESIPDLPHKPMIGLVGLADYITRMQHIGSSGNHRLTGSLEEMASSINLTKEQVERVIPRIHELVGERAEALGLGDTPLDHLFMESIAGANVTLGRINETLERRTRQMSRYEQVIRAITDFHEQATPAQPFLSVCGRVIASAAREFGRGFYGMIVPSPDEKQWRICQFATDGRLLRSENIDTKTTAGALDSLADDLQMSVEMMGLLPCLSDCFTDAEDIRRVRLLPLRNGWGLTAVLVHDRDISKSGLTRPVLSALCETWASAIAAARQHDGARRLGEQLAEANRRLTETQAKLARSKVMAALGELAAGAAHEMNNPLTVISGRSQVLASELSQPRHRRMAEQLVEQANRLSDLITMLHLFADPPCPDPAPVNLAEMIGRVVKTARKRCESRIPINVTVSGNLPAVLIDGEQVGLALMELIMNALQADPQRFVDVEVKPSPVDSRLLIMVRDDGIGMDEHTLNHAFDPFFSQKIAGRQPGLGLARAQRFITAHKGEIKFESRPRAGTTATILLPMVLNHEEGKTNKQSSSALKDQSLLDDRAA